MGTLGYIVGTFLAKLLSIAGIGGAIAGLFSKNSTIAVVLGAAMGVVDTLVLSSLATLPLPPISWIMAIFVGILMALATYNLWGKKRRAK